MLRGCHFPTWPPTAKRQHQISWPDQSSSETGSCTQNPPKGKAGYSHVFLHPQNVCAPPRRQAARLNLCPSACRHSWRSECCVSTEASSEGAVGDCRKTQARASISRLANHRKQSNTFIYQCELMLSDTLLFQMLCYKIITCLCFAACAPEASS